MDGIDKDLKFETNKKIGEQITPDYNAIRAARESEFPE